MHMPLGILVVYSERPAGTALHHIKGWKSSTVGYVESLHAKAIELSRLSVEMTAVADSGHPTSASSLAHIVAALMYGHMRFDPSDPANPTADRLVLSEGHACPIVYAAGAELGLAIGRNSA